MDIEFKNKTNGINPNLKKVVLPNTETELKSLLVDFVGEQQNPENGSVTVEMIIEALTEQFPELVLALAEENWIRGYHQAFADIEATHEAAQESIKNGE